MRCLNPFNNQKALDKHEEYCSNHEAVKIIMPEKGTMLKFKNYHRGEKVPFVIYADFEYCINRYTLAIQIPKIVILNNTKNTSQSAFIIILNPSIVKYIYR